jgi:hypothetical protein
MKAILKIFGPCLLSMAIHAPAHAEWRVEAGNVAAATQAKVASLESRRDDREIRARLVISCESTKTNARLVPSVELSKPFLFPGGQVYARYRTDDGEFRRGAVPLRRIFSHTVQLSKLEPAELQTANRLEVRINLAAAPSLSFAFDLAGADRAIAAIPCRRAS